MRTTFIMLLTLITVTTYAQQESHTLLLMDFEDKSGVQNPLLAHVSNTISFLGRPTGALGKSRLDGREEEIQLLLNKGVSLACIAKIMEISRTALGHFIKTRKLD
ncbi:MAG: hypothetical protein ACE1ZS_12625 [Candidatus Poribacteria bacterium]